MIIPENDEMSSAEKYRKLVDDAHQLWKATKVEYSNVTIELVPPPPEMGPSKMMGMKITQVGVKSLCRGSRPEKQSITLYSATLPMLKAFLAEHFPQSQQ